MKVFDLSWNNLAGNEDPKKVQEVVDMICTMIMTKDKLVHVNLDYNNFDDFDMCEQIADALKDNHTIYGFHFTGHCGYVDNLGFYQVR